ncbi:MAG TPA: phospholipase D-like domain-containing protein [Candidatus Paceibacterota bacterium]
MQFKAFHTVSDIWEAQLRDIESAKHSILLEQYIIEDVVGDGIGRRFVDALVRKAREGVEVRCILDAQGCFELFKNYELNNELAAAGGKVFYYKTLGVTNVVTPARLFLRDHRKLLLVDRETTWIGGAVIGERFRDWQDLMVRFTDAPLADVCGKEFRNQLLRLQEKGSLLAPLQKVDEETHITGNAPGIGNRFCYEELSHAIMLADTSVTLVTPYFAPPLKLQRVINRRLRDGLEINLIVPRTSDKRLADIAREGYFEDMLKHGLILKYVPGMLHAKIVVVDNEWMSFGSTNLDAISLIFNHELNLVTRNADLIAEVCRIVRGWTDGLERITTETCEYRKMSALEHFLGRCVRFIA